MYKVSWIYIPISIIIIIIITIIVIRNLLYNIKKGLKNSIKETCNVDKVVDIIPKIEPFNDKNFDKSKALSLNYINYSVSKFCGCKQELKPFTDDFIVSDIYDCYDSYAKKNRNIAVLFYSNKLKMVILSFSGTHFLSEWIDDINFNQINPNFVNNKNILIHEGFYNMYISMRDQILNSLDLFQNDELTFICTGHSLGGCLASICYLDLISNNNLKNLILYSFGAPRVGNIEFANVINNSRKNNTVWRIVNTEDIIPIAILPVINSYIYENYENLYTFTLNLSDNRLNHIKAYTQFLSQ